MKAGDIVRVLPPFSEAFPETYNISVISGTTATLNEQFDFDLGYLEFVSSGTGTASIPKPPMTRFEFLSRLTTQQRIAIRTSALSDPILQDALSMLDCAQEISTSNQFTIDMINYCVYKGLLTEQDTITILA